MCDWSRVKMLSGAFKLHEEIVMSDWDSYVSKPVNNADVESAVIEYRHLAAEKKSVEERMEALSYKILNEASGEPGEHVLRVGADHVVHIRIPETYKWDQSTLQGILNDETDLPEFVRKTLSVDKRRFDSLDDDERKKLLPALTRKPGKPSIKVHEVDQ